MVWRLKDVCGAIADEGAALVASGLGSFSPGRDMCTEVTGHSRSDDLGPNIILEFPPRISLQKIVCGPSRAQDGV